MKTIHFNPEGGPLSVEVRAGFAQPGSYALMLWEANQNAVVWQRRGNFINTDDDLYPLPGPAAVHHNRLLDCLATFTITPPIDRYRLQVIVFQEGAELGMDVREGKSDLPTLTVEIFVQLST